MSKKLDLNEFRQDASLKVEIPDRHAVSKFEVTAQSPQKIVKPKVESKVLEGVQMTAAEIRQQSGVKISETVTRRPYKPPTLPRVEESYEVQP